MKLTSFSRSCNFLTAWVQTLIQKTPVFLTPKSKEAKKYLTVCKV